jgi:hypothetical protein
MCKFTHDRKNLIFENLISTYSNLIKAH